MGQLTEERICVVGMGLMGLSIATCLLAAGHQVLGFDLEDDKLGDCHKAILDHLQAMQQEGLLSASPDDVIKSFETTSSLSDVNKVFMIIEAISEDFSLKQQFISDIEAVVGEDVIIASNTSSFPITDLQRKAKFPGRVVGLHWAEPAHVTQFMEIISGQQTDPTIAEKVRLLSERWGKQPSLLKKDVRGFITNRIMYAMMREAFHLVETGVCTMEDVDRSVCNDMGSWMTFAGPFRWMDLTGISNYMKVMEGLNPELCNSAEVPKLMRDCVAAGSNGVSNAKGFYDYTDESAKDWHDKFLAFSFDIRKLSRQYEMNK